MNELEELRKKKILAGFKSSLQGEPGYEGKVSLRHTSSNPKLKAFHDPDLLPSSVRYDGDGGNYGGKGVYLDADGKWTEGQEGMRWSPGHNYDVEGYIRNGKVITPDNVFDYTRDIKTGSRLVDGSHIVSKAQAEGRDAVIIKGFDARELPFSEENWDRNNRHYIEKNVDPNIAQDQVIHLEPKRLSVRPSTPGTKFEFTEFKTPNNVGPQALELALILGAEKAAHIGDSDAAELPKDEQIKKDTFNELRRQKKLSSLKK